LIPSISWGNIGIMKSFLEARKKIFGVAAIFVLIMVMMNLNSRLSEYFHLDRERDKLSTQVGYLELTRVAVDTLVAYATSDQAVEDWARNEAHMARPGDMVVIQITPANQTPVPQVEVTTTPRVVENWEVWWALFFGQ
jgi:cell division protein FtsB